MREGDAARARTVRTVAEPPLFGSSSDEPRLLFASSTPERTRRRRSGLRTWFAAAASLVIGILIGFYSGYQARENDASSPAAAAAPRDAQNSAPKSASTTGFSESTVPDPSRGDPEPIVPAPATPPPPAPVAREAERPAAKPTSQERAARTAVPPSDSAPAPGRTAKPDAPRDGASARRTTPVEGVTAAGPGTVRVLSRPAGAAVVLDGRVIGKTPLEIGALPAGPHSIRLELPGFNHWETTVDLKPGDELRVAGTLEQQ